MQFFPGDELFESAQPSALHLKAEWQGGGHSGTCFPIAMVERTKQLVAATARHLLEVPADRCITWTFTEYSQHDDIVRQATEQTDLRSQRINRYEYCGDEATDVGLFWLPILDSQGKQFARDTDVPPLIDEGLAVSEGTTVAWVGYSDAASSVLGHPKLCYYEGRISALINRADRKLYLVEGHIAHGVSGGPVWFRDAKSNSFKVIGIVRSYSVGDPRLPGLCAFDPIRTVLLRLKHCNEEAQRIREGG